MARNEEISVYGIPEVYKNRYNHQYSCRRKTTFNIGDIVPIYTSILVQPGDTISMNMRSFFRLTTSLFPPMDNLTADIFCFAEDWQNVWEHTKEFWGEDEATPFEELPEYTIPQIELEPDDEILHDDILHHISLPQMKSGEAAIPEITRVNKISVEALSYRTYIDIYNRFFRDQNYITKFVLETGDTQTTPKNGKFPAGKYRRTLLKAARLHDYFSGTPEAQKGDPETLPLGTTAPITGTGTIIGNGNPVTWTNPDGTNSTNITTAASGDGELRLTPSSGLISTMYAPTDATDAYLKLDMTNTQVDLANAVASTLNALRLVTANQHIKEELMWYGSRFEEIIFSQWGVSMDATSFRIPEYLGGKRISLNMDTVLQTSSSDAESPQGNAAGYSVTFDEDHLFTKSFKTWQILMILVVVRQDHTYSYGVANQHLKKRKFDFYWDKFDGLGAQPRSKAEIALTGTDSDNDTWNFAPAWREYISEVDRATGLMVPGVDNSLANYTYNDEYTSVPNSGEEWINEIPNYVDRTLVVPSSTTDQIMADFVFEINKTSIIKNYKLPGLDKL